MPGITQALRPCPAAWCTYIEQSHTLMVHWRAVHESRTILYLCLLPLCTYLTPRQHNLRTHCEKVHGTTRSVSTELRSLPFLDDFVPNRNQADPGSCRPPEAPLQLPVGSLPHSAKPTLLVWVQVILGGEQLCQGAPAPKSHPSVSGVVLETPWVGKSEDASLVQPEKVVPEVVEIQESEEEREPEEMSVSQVQEAAATPPCAESCSTDLTPVPLRLLPPFPTHCSQWFWPRRDPWWAPPSFLEAAHHDWAETPSWSSLLPLGPHIPLGHFGMSSPWLRLHVRYLPQPAFPQRPEWPQQQ